MNRQEDLQIRHPVGFDVGAHDRSTGWRRVVMDVMTAQVSVNDVRTSVVRVMILANVGVDERRSQRPCLQGTNQPDRDQAAQHVDAILAGSGIGDPGTGAFNL
jgi:hypothetical protein